MAEARQVNIINRTGIIRSSLSTKSDLEETIPEPRIAMISVIMSELILTIIFALLSAMPMS